MGTWSDTVWIESRAKELGFDLCGVVPAGKFPELEHTEEWLARGFAGEMNHARADWQLIMYGGAEHGFTHSRAAPGAIPGVAYEPLADARSFAATRAQPTAVPSQR